MSTHATNREPTGRRSALRRKGVRAAVPIMALTCILVGVTLAGLWDYSFLHVGAALFGLFVGIGLFVCYRTRGRPEPGPLVPPLAAGFLGAGIVGALHLLWYPAIGILGGQRAAAYACQLWLLARVLEASAILAAVAGARRAVSQSSVCVAFGGAALAGVVAVVFWDAFPACRVGGAPTAFATAARMLVLTLLIGGAVLAAGNHDFAGPGTRRALLLASALLVVSVVCLGLPADDPGLFGIVGQAATMLAYVAVCAATVRAGSSRAAAPGAPHAAGPGKGDAWLAVALREMPAGVIVLDASEDVLLVANDHATAILGEQLAVGERLEDYIMGRVLKPSGEPMIDAESPLTRALKTGRAVRNEEVDFLRADGSRVHLLVSATPVRGEQGDIVAGVVAFQDISARVEMREALSAAYRKLEGRVEAHTRDLEEANEALQREVEDRRRAEQTAREAGLFAENIVQTVREGLVVTRRESGRIVSANPAFCLMVGLPRSKVLGRRLDDLGPGVGLPSDTATRIRMVVQNGEEFTGFETPFQLKGGDERWVALGGAPVRKDGGGSEEFLISFDDITQRKEAEKRILSYQEQLRSLARELTLAEERERQRIAGDLHDGIAQTLATVNLKLGLLAVDSQEEGTRSMLSEVRDAVSAAIEETRTMSFDLSPVCLHVEGLDAAVHWFAEHVEEHYGLPVEVRSPEFRGSLDGDLAALLYRAVRELLLNVVKHAEASRAEVSISVEERSILIVVRDDGRGFDVSALNASPVRLKGFGLFNVRERLRDLGGNMEIQSEPGQGTSVHVNVPWRGKKDPEVRT